MFTKFNFAIRYENKLKYFKIDRPIHIKQKHFPDKYNGIITIYYV